MLFIVFVRGDIGVRVFTIIYLVMFYFTGCGRPMMICYYFMFLMFKANTKGYHKENCDKIESGRDQRNEGISINYCQ